MKYYILATLIYFSYTVVFAMEDACVEDCSYECQVQVEKARKALNSHQNVCRGEEATVTTPVCAQACSTGCKNVMRGQRQMIVEHYENCGGGDGSMGRLVCEKVSTGYRVLNTHSLKYIGSVHSLPSQCEESANTLNYNVFCAKTSTGYAVYNLLGNALGVSSSFIHQCDESIMSIRDEKICVKTSRHRFGIYDLRTMKRVGKDYKFFSSCRDDL